MSKHVCTEFPEDEIQWQVWIVPDYDEKNSLMLMRAQHVVGDGVGLMLMLSFINDGGYDRSQFI